MSGAPVKAPAGVVSEPPAGRPDFIDNRGGNTLGRALSTLLDTDGDPGAAIRIATAFFNPGGFARIADRLERAPAVRLLLGAPPVEAGDERVRRRPGESPADFDRRRVEAGLRRLDAGLRRERDRAPFSPDEDAARSALLRALRRGNIEVRRYERAFLHAKAYLIGGGGRSGLVVGSANLTRAGLTSNLELSLGRHDPGTVARAAGWFDDLWEEAEPYDLAALYEEAVPPRTPWEVFLRVLFQLYGAETTADIRADGNLPLTNFQQHGVVRALRLIEQTGGALVADEVGLGKTFIAGEIARHYRDRRQRALLVCPASLRDSTWKRFLSDHQLHLECVSFEELAMDEQLRDPSRPRATRRKILRPLDDYQLVVVDEAHNYRNPDAPYRAGALRRLLAGRRRDVLLLTATPVNNRLWDLYHLIRFFVRQDGRFADRGIPSLRGLFRLAERDPSNLSPELLYPVLDATTVKRTRQFVKKHYAGDTIPGPDGAPRRIEFPKPRAVSVRYPFAGALADLFDQVERALDPDAPEAISFARYRPDAFRRKKDPKQVAEAAVVAGLLRSGLLKRFESSAHAFRNTAAKMVEWHDLFLQALDRGQVLAADLLDEIGAGRSSFDEIVVRQGRGEDAKGFAVPALRRAVERDRDRLRRLTEAAERITPEGDAKLLALETELASIAAAAEREGATDGVEARDKAKVLVFSFYRDTVSWISRFLEGAVQRNPGLARYRGRIAVVGDGADDAAEMGRWEAARGFAPVSMEGTDEPAKDRYDLLLSTDVLAEGVNLQQCRHLVNFDLPWNPMRLVQRHGRIDRIGSRHREVFLRTVFPAARLEEVLELERRIHEKIAMAAVSVGVRPPIAGGRSGQQVFTETRKEIERLVAEDPSLYERGGAASAAQTGEEYRQTLRLALEDDPEWIGNLPWKMGSGKRGARRGMFFCAVAGRGDAKLEQTFLRFVPADRNWNPDPGREFDELPAEADSTGLGSRFERVETEVARCLRLIECEESTPTCFPDGTGRRAHAFWKIARSDVHAEWERRTDPKHLDPKVAKVNREAAEFLRKHAPPDLERGRVDRASDILGTSWPRREERLLREELRKARERGAEGARKLVAWVLATGLEPGEPPVRLPSIAPEEIELLCWMAIAPDDPPGG